MQKKTDLFFKKAMENQDLKNSNKGSSPGRQNTRPTLTAPDLATLWETIPSACLILDQWGMVRKVNQAFRDLVGLEFGKGLGKAFSSFVTAPDQALFESWLFCQADQAEKKFIDLNLKRSQNEHVRVRLSAGSLAFEKPEAKNEIEKGLILLLTQLGDWQADAAQDAHIRQVLRATRNINRLIITETDPVRLIQGATENMTAQLGYHNAWIALVDNISQKVTEVAASNIGDSFKELEKNLKGGVFTCKMQEALLENRLILVKDPDKECPDCPLADKYSNRSGMTRRLEFEGQVFGVVSVSVPKEYALDIEEQNLFSELVRDLAFGLYKIQAEVQLERIKKVIRTIPSPMSFLDSEYRYLAVNNSYSQFFSVASKEIIGRKPQDFMGEEIFNQEIKPHLDRALAGESVRYEVEVDFPGKGRRFMEMVYMPFREKNGEVVGIISHGTDITDLKISEKQLSKVINNTPVGICVTDENGYFIKVNPAYCRLYNYKESELLGKHFTIVVPEEHKKELNQLHRDFIAGGMELRGEWQVVDKNGKEISIIADATAIKDMLGRPQKVTFVMDITERKELEQLKEDVDRIMRHDLKQPLNAIIGMPQILEMDDNLTEEQLVNLGYIKTAGKNMLHMIDSTLDLFKMETGKYNYQPRMVDLVRAVWQLLDQNQTIMNAKELTFGFTIDNHEVKQGDSYKIWSEERLLYSLLSNLFINALEASPYNEKVVIRVLEADQIVVSIENKGAIPEQVREHFFEKYKTYGKKRGTGLGTYSAYLIATTMHYKLEAETSDQEDRTSISVFIPKEAPIVKQDQSEN